jgi:hypothetical protein
MIAYGMMNSENSLLWVMKFENHWLLCDDILESFIMVSWSLTVADWFEEIKK